MNLKDEIKLLNFWTFRRSWVRFPITTSFFSQLHRTYKTVFRKLRKFSKTMFPVALTVSSRNATSLNPSLSKKHVLAHSMILKKWFSRTCSTLESTTSVVDITTSFSSPKKDIYSSKRRLEADSTSASIVLEIIE